VTLPDIPNIVEGYAKARLEPVIRALDDAAADILLLKAHLAELEEIIGRQREIMRGQSDLLEAVGKLSKVQP